MMTYIGLMLLAVPVALLVMMNIGPDEAARMNATAQLFMVGIPSAAIGLILVLIGLSRSKKHDDL